MNKQNKKHDRDKVKLVPSCSETGGWVVPLHANRLPKMAFALQRYHLIITRKIEWQSLVVPMVSAAERLFLLLVLSVVVELWAKAPLARTFHVSQNSQMLFVRSWILGALLLQVLSAVFSHLWLYLVIWCLSCSRKCIKIANEQNISKFQCFHMAGELLSRFDGSVWWGLQIFCFFSWELSFWRHKCGKDSFCCSHQSRVSEHWGAQEIFQRCLQVKDAFQTDRKNKLLWASRS